MQNNDNREDGMRDTHNMLKNMNEVMAQMQRMMENENVMNNPMMKHHVELIQRNIDTTIHSMSGFLDNLQELQRQQ